MWSTLRRVYWMIAVVLVSGCSGGGCSGCAGGAIAPIPGGYPLAPETRIPRAAQIRLSENGLNRLEAIAPGLLGGLVGGGIPVPTVSQNLSVGRAIVCPSGRCPIAHHAPTTGALDLASPTPTHQPPRARVSSTATSPSALRRLVQRHLRRHLLRHHRVAHAQHQHRARQPSVHRPLDQGDHPPRHPRAAAELPPRRPRLAHRLGRRRAGDPRRGHRKRRHQLHRSWVCGIVNLLRGTIINLVRGQISGALGPIADALAMSSMPNPPGCPTGTTAAAAPASTPTTATSRRSSAPTARATSARSSRRSRPASRANVRLHPRGG
jgi:hypothetical protein